MSRYPTVVLASRNLKKSAEIRALLAPFGIPLKPVSDFPEAKDVVEDGDSFRANADKKSTQTAIQTGCWSIGEDSGLRVDALNGAPGIFSARFSGENATDAANNAKLIEELRSTPLEKRGAEYVCHISVSDPQGNVRLNIEATCRGLIAEQPAGENGFGYDPHFMVREYHRTFGELSPLVKQQLSHRARAFSRLIPLLLKTLSAANAGS
ncbi:non-canonical purine NTP pyrophosphatase [Planctomicrobium sp. SH668]|uniref:non-canonical purine NTP pyrophosphatase n=1 Tax=Planctomicrobium sp. SH668 TaxID=3448126 RepID=UPI003F5AF61C